MWEKFLQHIIEYASDNNIMFGSIKSNLCYSSYFYLAIIKLISVWGRKFIRDHSLQYNQFEKKSLLLFENKNYISQCAMVAVPIVKSFCGCCDLKVSCVVIASIRLVLAIILFVIIICYLLMFGYIFSEIDKSNTQGKIDYAAYHLADEIYNWFILLIPVVLINIVFSYWFIQSVTTVRSK